MENKKKRKLIFEKDFCSVCGKCLDLAAANKDFKVEKQKDGTIEVDTENIDLDNDKNLKDLKNLEEDCPTGAIYVEE